MKAMLCTAYGGPEGLALQEVADPVPGSGEVAVRVSHAGVSFVDGLMVADKHQNKHELPFAPGMEIAGEVHAVGADVDGIVPGDRVAALVYDGGWAEIAIAKVTEVFPLPSNVPYDVAAGCLSVYLTAYLALTDVAELQEGETLIVTGAAGGVGLAAVDIGAAVGANVVACASSPEKLEIAVAAGADGAILSDPPDGLRAGLSEACPDGTDVVLDPVAGPLYESAFRSLDWGGRYISVGFAGGAIPQIPANLLLVKNRSARGFALMYYRRFRTDKLQAAAFDLFEWMAEGKLQPLISKHGGLEEAPALLADVLARRAVGKGVLAVGETG